MLMHQIKIFHILSLILGKSVSLVKNRLLSETEAYLRPWQLKTKGSCKLRVDAGGEDRRHWKNLLENRFTKETTCLPFSMSDFPQFITTFICCVKQMKQQRIS